MSEIASIEKITAHKDTYTLKIAIPKTLLPHFQEIFHNFSDMAHDLAYKARLASEQSEERREAHRREVEERDSAVLEQIREAYAEAFEQTRNIREALKVVTMNFRDWWWIRAQFKKEVEAKRDLEIMRLANQGLIIRKIAQRVGLHPNTVCEIKRRSRRAQGHF